jgi:HSP20 family molecular chaperone IbpA
MADGLRSPHDRLPSPPLILSQGLANPEVIRGWEMAVATMKPNEVAEITCSPEYAFGSAEGYQDKIPPGAIIVTRLQLLNWRTLQGAGSTDVEDTRDLTKKWREEIDEGTSPMTTWAAPPTVRKDSIGEATAEVNGENGGGSGPLAEAKAAMEKEQREEEQQQGEGIDGFSPPSTPRVEAIPEDANKGMKVDIDDMAMKNKLNPNQVVIGTAPQYKWKERAGYMEVVVPVPEEVKKEDVLVHLTNRVLTVGFKTPEKKESWIIGGDLFGPIELESSFWVLSKDYTDELTEGKTCVEVRLEKKEPMRRIWSTVFKDQ